MSDYCQCPKCSHLFPTPEPAPSPQPEMPDVYGAAFAALSGADIQNRNELRKALATQCLTIVGPAERAVLDACAAMTLGDDDPDEDPLEPQELGEDCYIYTDDQDRIARAEKARRAAKEGTGG